MTQQAKKKLPPGMRYLPSGNIRWEKMVDGRRFSGTARNVTEARNAQAMIVADAQRGGLVDPSQITIGEYLERWLEGKKASRAVRSHQIQAGLLDLHIRPTLGPKRLQKLSPADLRGFFDTLNRERVVEGKQRQPLGRSSQRLIHQFLYQALQDALEIELVPRNVAAIVRPTPPRARDDEDEEVDAYNPTEAAAFVQAARQDHRGRLFEFALGSGLRPGELCGLRWADVDWEARTVSVRETVVKAGTQELLSTPKTKGSRRRVHLDASTMSVLRQQQQEQDTARLVWRDKWRETGRVFTAIQGQTLHPNNLKRDMRRIYTAAGLRHLRVHGLRHTYASLNLMHGVPVEVVSKQLGHASVEFTMRVYRTVYKAERQAYALGVDALVTPLDRG